MNKNLNIFLISVQGNINGQYDTQNKFNVENIPLKIDG